MSFTAVSVGKQPNIQDAFLASARRTAVRVTMFLMNGYQLRGVITAYDPYARGADAYRKLADEMLAKHAK